MSILSSRVIRALRVEAAASLSTDLHIITQALSIRMRTHHILKSLLSFYIPSFVVTLRLTSERSTTNLDVGSSSGSLEDFSSSCRSSASSFACATRLLDTQNYFGKSQT